MQHPTRRWWLLRALALLGLAALVAVGWSAAALADPAPRDEHSLERQGWLARQQAVDPATTQDRSASESIRQSPWAAKPGPRFDHEPQIGREPVPVQFAADRARPAPAGVPPSRVAALALAGLAFAAGPVWLAHRWRAMTRRTK